jgi:dimethylhistidine N-methyltransferase
VTARAKLVDGGDAAAEQRRALLADALSGLGQVQTRLPCKWFYDAAGAALFEHITRIPEYYPTRAEEEILESRGREIADRIGPDATVVELGPGDGRKAVLLLRGLRAPKAYVPVDIAPEWLLDAARRVSEAFADLPVHPVVGDFAGELTIPPFARGEGAVGFFPGSTIGNFAQAEAVALLARLRAALGTGAKLLIGADLVKAPETLIAAYDDAAGVTAAFNLNLLVRLNRELGADFDLSAFRHRAVWNAEDERVEMYLVSLRRQSVSIAGTTIAFAEGEAIHTENSHKFRPDSFRAIAERGGWTPSTHWTDSRGLFSVWLLTAG